MLAQARKYYVDRDSRPFLFMVVFGVLGEGLEVSQSRHHVDCVPKDLELHFLSRSRHADYIDGFFQGDLGVVLRSSNPTLFDACRDADTCVVINGQIKDDATLDYMRNVIGIVQSLIEQGAVGVLDMTTFTLRSPREWTERFFEKEVDARNHVVIILSDEENGSWLHTRGMLAFGRPDLSMRGVERNRLDTCREAFGQMIFYSGEGALFDGEYCLHSHDGGTYRIRSQFVDDFDNDDFNNAYCEVTLLEERAEYSVGR